MYPRSTLVGVSFVAAVLGNPGLEADSIAQFEGVDAANPKTPGISAPSILTRELIQSSVAQGSMPLDGGTADFPCYGYDGDGTMLPLPGAVQSPGHNVEATKTEPDKNTYLILQGLGGADPGHDYGTHFLYQGHELGVRDPVTGQGKGYITRINLDADGAHRVTLLASTDVAGNPLPVFDGSTWYPWSGKLLFSFEGGRSGGIWQATPDYPSAVQDVSGIFGRAGYEGIQADSDGNIWIVEDTGGGAGSSANHLTHARQPNSFVYRFVPKDRRDLLMGGKLQALQVLSQSNPGQPIVFHAGAADLDILSLDVKDLHTYGRVFLTQWVTIHDTDVDGMAPFDANALAKANLATPFKRPENGLFRPGSGFRQFFFDETGDTSALTEAGAQYGGFGSILVLTQLRPSAHQGLLRLFYLGDVEHTGLDNCAFWDKDHIVFVEDGGDTLHTQRNALDSAFLFDVNADYGNPATDPPIRILALGRDPSATIDSGLGSVAGSGFQNDGDNEITGFHVSDGDPGKGGILGAKIPTPFQGGWRAFYTAQHGDNGTFELHSARALVEPRPDK